MKTVFALLIWMFVCFSYSQTIKLTSFASGFTKPVEIAHPNNDSRLFVAEQGGKIKIVNPNGTTNVTPFLTLTTATISSGGERGLLGLAFHPNYVTNGYFYVNYTNTSGNTIIARYSVSTDANIADASSSTILLTINQPFNNHNGGSIKFGPDGLLYIGMGDGGGANDPGNRSQNINDNLGKMLRIDVDSDSPYGIPPTNPYVGIAGNDEIWAIGLRNPWKFSFNRLNGDLWISDVGQNAIEEINRTKSPLPLTQNYGWRCYEGTAAFITAGCVPVENLTMPFAEYNHNSGACSITGGYEYTGTTFPNFAGKYFFADYCSNKIGILTVENASYVWTSAFAGTNFSTFGEDVNGELYIAGVTNGIVYKIEDATLSINSFSKNNLELYPNPVTSEFTIKANSIQFPSTLQVTDVLGKVVLITALQSNTATIKTTSLQKGMYIVTIKEKTGSIRNTKLIIK